MLRSAHEVSTSKQHKSISASDVFKALELIEFADLIQPLQTELQGRYAFLSHTQGILLALCPSQHARRAFTISL
jgi:hypothetical protein